MHRAVQRKLFIKNVPRECAYTTRMFCTTLLQCIQYWQKKRGHYSFFYSQVWIANTRSDNVMFLNHLASNITLCEADPNLHAVKWQDLQ